MALEALDHKQIGLEEMIQREWGVGIEWERPE